VTISIIIPVLHEPILLIRDTSRIFCENTGSVPDLIIVDGDQAGSSINSITDKNVIRLIALAGRGSQLAAGAAVAGGDILLLLHADTRLPEGALSAVERAIANGAAWGAFRLGIDAAPLPYRVIEFFVELRCRLFKLPYGDQAMFVTREALSVVGGIPQIPLMEDVALARALAKAKLPFTLLPARVCTSARRWQQDGIVRRTLKNWWLLLRYLSGVKPEKLAREYGCTAADPV